MTVTVEVINEGAFPLLRGMERLDLIRINAPVETAAPERMKLSEQFAGALRLSDAQYEAYQTAIQEGKNEWNRVIY
jgi:hypothetical protein